MLPGQQVGEERLVKIGSGAAGRKGGMPLLGAVFPGQRPKTGNGIPGPLASRRECRRPVAGNSNLGRSLWNFPFPGGSPMFDQVFKQPYTLTRSAAGPLLEERHPWKFSCAGFVIEAYRYAGLDLLITEQARIPPVGRELLDADASRPRCKSAPPRTFQTPPGGGPWHVILAGYVLNALNRPADAIRREPYRPVSGDGFFQACRM